MKKSIDKQNENETNKHIIKPENKKNEKVLKKHKNRKLKIVKIIIKKKINKTTKKWWTQKNKINKRKITLKHT